MACAVALGALLAAGHSRADTLIVDRPGYHQRYDFEAEPHLLVGFMDPPGPAHGSGVGVGFRGTVQLVENGFISRINNSVGLGFGMDFVHYGYSDYCAGWDAGGRCAVWGDNRAVDELWFPVVMQWNFWLSRNWSVFGEPGLALRYESNDGGDHRAHVDFLQLYLGGRFHFGDTVALTMRVGYPTFAVGVSFFL